MKSRLAWLGEHGHADLVRHGLRGIEKECLRIDADGRLSRKPHPPALGAALTHPHITTDYSEALLEFVTPPCATNWETLQFLCDIHCFVAQNLGDELLWAQSMPCVVGPDEDVPIAYYGESNLGRMKTIYRRGLGHRYGRAMQAIAGIHFNYSLPVGFWAAYQDNEKSDQDDSAFISDQYLRMARNYRRNAWVLIYLFGASPALCKSFPLRAGHGLEELDPHTWYLPYGTSLRMSDVGYRNKSQARLQISLNSLTEYVGGLTTAVTSSSPEYERIGVEVDGEYRQLNTNMLQIENEYYAAVRPKPKAKSGSRPTVALRQGGVEYLEIRTLDLNVADPIGVNQTQLRFIEALLLYCLFADSPPIDASEQAEIDQRELLVAREGRRPGLEIPVGGAGVLLQRVGLDLLAEITPFAELLDVTDEGYADALEQQRSAMAEPELTPSAQLLADMTTRGQRYLDFMLEVSGAHAAYFRALTLAEDRKREFAELARTSVEDARDLEDNTQESLEDYLAAYFAQA
ncbi:MAG: glutamate--cysteine ligase [Gammaproteobacteria bacterium]|nr:glutamate--cysteine ligase [Gammaproteobacteria bacterium]